MGQSTQGRSVRQHFVKPFNIGGKAVTTSVRSAGRAIRRDPERVRNFIKAKLTCDYNQQKVCLDFSCGLITDTVRRSIETKVYYSIADFIKEGNTVEQLGSTLRKVYTPQNAVLQGAYEEFSCDWEHGGKLTTTFPSWLPMAAFSMTTREVGRDTLMVSAQGNVEFTIERTDQATIKREDSGTVTRPSSGTTVSRPSSGTTVTRPSSGTTVSRPSSGTTVSRPSSGTTVSRPSSGSTVTRPSTSSTPTRPSSGNTVYRPSTGTTATESPAPNVRPKPATETTTPKRPAPNVRPKPVEETTTPEPATENVRPKPTGHAAHKPSSTPEPVVYPISGTHTENVVSPTYTKSFNFCEKVKILDSSPLSIGNRQVAAGLGNILIAKAKLSCDFKQQKVRLSITCGQIVNTIQYLLEEVKVDFPISDFIWKGEKQEEKQEDDGNSWMTRVPIDAVLKGEYKEASTHWRMDALHPTNFPSWLPASDFGMEIRIESKGIATLTIKGKVCFQIERTDELTYAKNLPIRNASWIVRDKEKSEAIGKIIGALIADKRLIPEYPIVKDESKLTNGLVLTSIDGDEYMIPDLELKPYFGLLFRYEDMINSEGGNDGILGFVQLWYDLKVSQPDFKALPVEIDSVCLNLKSSKVVIPLYGEVDPLTHKLKFNLKDEAVKIAFFNLNSQIEANQCDVDVFLKFKGYCIQKKIQKT